MAFNKRGGNLGGRSGKKRGGGQYTSETPIDQGTLTCPRCEGSGSVERPHLETDEDGGFSGNDTMDCPRCSGSGTVDK